MAIAFSDEDRFSMTAERYLAKHNILVYLEDSVAQLLEHREENPKVNPIKYLAEYYSSLRDGNHMMFREYSFIRATPHNRASFVRLFWKCFRQIGKKGDLLSIREYHSLLQLLCPDFPFEPVQKTAKIVLMDDALDCLISFSDFLYAFQAQFYYEEFLEKSSEVYKSVLQTQRSPRETVVVPTSTGEQPSVKLSTSNPAYDGIDCSLFFRSLYPLCDRVEYSTPSVNVLKEILLTVSRVSFYGFLMAIAKSESINEAIGQLPNKCELLEGADQDLTVPVIRTKGIRNRPTSASSSSQTDKLGDGKPPTGSSSGIANETVRSKSRHVILSAKRGDTKLKVMRPYGKATRSETSSESSSDDSDGSSTN